MGGGGGRGAGACAAITRGRGGRDGALTTLGAGATCTAGAAHFGAPDAFQVTPAGRAGGVGATATGAGGTGGAIAGAGAALGAGAAAGAEAARGAGVLSVVEGVSSSGGGVTVCANATAGMKEAAARARIPRLFIDHVPCPDKGRRRQNVPEPSGNS